MESKLTGGRILHRHSEGGLLLSLRGWWRREGLLQTLECYGLRLGAKQGGREVGGKKTTKL